MKLAYPIVRFNGGEVSPLMKGRIDFEQMTAGGTTFQNCYPVIQGPVKKRGGTLFVARAKYDGQKTRLIPFECTDDAVYMLLFGNLYLRVYQNTGAFVCEIETPFTQDDLSNLSVASKDDVMYIASTRLPVKQLIRTTETTFDLSDLELVDGPYLPTNTTDVTVILAGSASPYGLTASSAVFKQTDIGRHIRLERTLDGVTTIGWGIIQSVKMDGYYVDVDMKTDFPTNVKTAFWRLGVFSDTTGYPSDVCFFEDRLVLAGSRIALSCTGQYETFSPTQTDGAVKESNGLCVQQNDDSNGTIKWECDKDVLFVGTSGEQFVLSSSSSAEALTPSNATAKRFASYGSQNVEPIKIDGGVLFVQRHGRKVRAITYSLENESFVCANLTACADHITQSGLISSALTQEPDPIVWFVREDGVLIGCLYDREQKIVAWHHHIIGGDNARVVDIAACSSGRVHPKSGDVYARDDLWLVVSRTVNGQTVTTLEILTGGLPDEETQSQYGFFVDGGLQIVSDTAFSSVSGLSHLEGQTVDVFTDGSVREQKVVQNGMVALDKPAKTAAVGLHYETVLETTDFSPDDDNGTSEGKVKHISKITVRLLNTVGLNMCVVSQEASPFFFFKAGDKMDEALPLFTGDKEALLSCGYLKNCRIRVTQSQPLPMTILGIYVTLSVNKT